MFRAGGGVLIMIGLHAASNFGVAALWMAGQLLFVGTGVAEVIGGVVALASHQLIYAGAGGTAFVGSGELAWIGMKTAFTAVSVANVRPLHREVPVPVSYFAWC